MELTMPKNKNILQEEVNITCTVEELLYIAEALGERRHEISIEQIKKEYGVALVSRGGTSYECDYLAYAVMNDFLRELLGGSDDCE